MSEPDVVYIKQYPRGQRLIFNEPRPGAEKYVRVEMPDPSEEGGRLGRAMAVMYPFAVVLDWVAKLTNRRYREISNGGKKR